jgi:hypothetical protein
MAPFPETMRRTTKTTIQACFLVIVLNRFFLEFLRDSRINGKNYVMDIS